MLNVYVGSKFQDWPRAARVVEQLEASGVIQCTSNWIAVARELSGNEDNRPLDELIKNAKMDQANLTHPDTDLFLLLTPVHPHSDWRLSGGWVELGMAIMAKKHIVICGEHRDQNVFCNLADYMVLDEELAIAYCIGYAKRKLP